MILECNICGEEMRKSSSDEWTCPSCLNKAYQLPTGEIYYEHDPSEHESLYDWCIDD